MKIVNKKNIMPTSGMYISLTLKKENGIIMQEEQNRLVTKSGSENGK